jgi:hypothetical protein
VFEDVYRRRRWGSSVEPDHPFCSGSGSKDPVVVDRYVDAMSRWLGQFTAPPSVVDLGCGDFGVGSRLRPQCVSYTAYDCVAPLIDSNRRRFAHLGVRFEQIDICTGPTVPADVYMIRQVLQHLSNERIQAAVTQCKERCGWLVVTEHLPKRQFKPNVDVATGPFTRWVVNSGVILTEPPFNLKVLEQIVLCSTDVPQGVIETVAYRLR